MILDHPSFAPVIVGIHLREILLRGSLLSFLLYDGCSWKTIAIVGSVWVMTMCMLYVSLWEAYIPNRISMELSEHIRMATPVSVGIVVGLLMYRWRKSVISSNNAPVAHVTTFYTFLFALCISIKIGVLFITDDMAYSGFSDIFICILATTIPGRQARHEKTIAEHIIESKRDYVSYLSHEIRTPLNAVYMGIQLLTKECAGVLYNKDVTDILTDIDNSCKVAIDILNEFLLANKLEAGNVTLEKEIVDAYVIINDVSKSFDAQARQRGVIYSHSGDCHIDPAISNNNVQLDADSRKLSQVMRNLISNALKFTPKGGRVDVYAYLTPHDDIPSPKRSPTHSLYSIQPQPFVSPTSTIPTKATKQVGRGVYGVGRSILRIEVHDTGVGISPENVQKLFGEIVQFNAAQLQNGGGSGIGLWISKKIVDLHGGRIGVTSELGNGSMFFMELEVADVATGTDVSKECNDNPAAVEMCVSAHNSVQNIGVDDLCEMKVLVVDDSAVNRKMLTRLIEPRVGHISQAENGLEAVTKVRESMERKSPFDLIFMDATMPEMCGIDATILIRGIGYKGMLVFLTGNVTPEDREQFMAAGANNVIAKPCTLETVERILRTVSSIT
eukprot:CAMPEP_0185021854 /NCGR_PEP_ID=MMETSP1103-20130426/4557_1 /TAXON_ID=36769 /ORGANISM="Paraphysomonas bandaiensis, Strain Caron Lab Isolate" /LENGTH=613 /DNA_ID=CAMNT_0027553619 /DNA_START=540 /DNA_END=2381 /DNA_ORIENTATION=-